MNLENVNTALDVGTVNGDLTVKAALKKRNEGKRRKIFKETKKVSIAIAHE